MARDFYKKDGSYYYSDNNQKISDIPELQAAAQAGGKEITYGETQTSWSEEEILQEIANKTAALENNPLTSQYVSYGNSAEDLAGAFANGDWSNVTDEMGQPFSIEQQQQALEKAKAMDDDYYDQLQQKETADAESTLAGQQADYQDYLINSGQQFEADKNKSDQSAANQGVLFSGGRVQREKNLQRAYTQDQSSAQRKIGSAIGNTARDFQYKYGNDAAQGLNKYYNLGGNTYNPNKARNNVGQSGLSNVYNTNKYKYAGTRLGERQATANQQAGSLLWNKGNKLVGTGYNNQY